MIAAKRAQQRDDVAELRAAIARGDAHLDAIVQAFARVLRSGSWRRQLVRGTIVEFDSIRHFVESPQERGGLGTTLVRLDAFVRSDPEIFSRFRRVLAGKGDAPAPDAADLAEAVVEYDEPEVAPARDNVTRDNVTEDARGNSRAYALKKLGEKDPALVERVMTGEISAQQGLIEAKIRKPAAVLPALNGAWKRASAEERVAFLEVVAAGPERVPIKAVWDRLGKSDREAFLDALVVEGVLK